MHGYPKFSFWIANSHALWSDSFTYTELPTAHPEQLAEVKSLGAEAWTIKVVTHDLFVPELGYLLRESSEFVTVSITKPGWFCT